MVDAAYIRLLIEELEKKLGYLDIKNMPDKGYEDLSDTIFKSTNIKISIITLKRITEKIQTDSNYRPQDASLDALSIVCGYKNWERFKRSKEIKRITSSIYIKISFFVVGISSLILLYVYIPKSNEANYKLDFSTEDTLVLSAPATVNFKYKVTNDSDIDARVYFGDSEYRGINSKKNYLAHLYSHPYYFNVLVKTSEKLEKSLYIHVLSTDWQAMLPLDNPNKYFLLKENPKTDGRLFVNDSIIKENTEKSAMKKHTLTYIKSDTFNFECENTEFQTRIRNRSLPEKITNCSYATITLIGKGGRISVRTGIEGCSELLFFRVGEKAVTGVYEDLSMLCSNLGEWTDLKFLSKDNKVKFYINDAQKYELEYNRKIGLLKAILVEFTSSGEVDYVRIKNLEGDTLYANEF